MRRRKRFRTVRCYRDRNARALEIGSVVRTATLNATPQDIVASTGSRTMPFATT